MFGSYRLVYGNPGAIRISFAGIIARIPIAMDALAILYVCIQSNKTYSLAGALAGVAALTTVFSAPVWAKVADNKGQKFVLRWAVLIRVSALLVFVFLTSVNSPVWLWFISIMVAECASFSVGAFTRRRWAYLLEQKSKEEISTAYAVESVFDECVFILGPLIATLIATQITAEAAILAGIIFLLIGTQVLAWDQYSEPLNSNLSTGILKKSVMTNRHLQAVAIPLTIAGGYFSAITLVVVAFAKENNAKSFSGILLSLWALGGALSVFANGAMRWKISHGTRFITYTITLCVFSLSMAFVHNFWLLAISLILQGACIGPLLPNAIPVIEKSVPSYQMTQGISLITAGIPLTGAVSSFITGQSIDHFGIDFSQWLPFGFMLLSALSMIPFWRFYTQGSSASLD